MESAFTIDGNGREAAARNLLHARLRFGRTQLLGFAWERGIGLEGQGLRFIEDFIKDIFCRQTQRHTQNQGSQEDEDATQVSHAAHVLLCTTAGTAVSVT